jgi:feruloyl esterase
MGTRKPMIPMPLFNLKVAKYNGNGSTSIAANFTCITSKNHLNQTPVPKFGP